MVRAFESVMMYSAYPTMNRLYDDIGIGAAVGLVLGGVIVDHFPWMAGISILCLLTGLALPTKKPGATLKPLVDHA